MSKHELLAFRGKALQLEEVTDAELKGIWVECGADANSDMVSLDVSAKFEKLHPEFHRNCGASSSGGQGCANLSLGLVFSVLMAAGPVQFG